MKVYKVLIGLGRIFTALFALELWGEISMYSRAGWHFSDVTLTSEPILVAFFSASPAVVLFALARLVRLFRSGTFFNS